jgi:putative serine protease PepD
MALVRDVWDPSPADPHVADRVGIGEDRRMTTYPEGQEHGTEEAPSLPSFPAPDPSSRVSGPPAPTAASAATPATAPPAYAAPVESSPWAPPPAPSPLAAAEPTAYEPPQPTAVDAEAMLPASAAASDATEVPAYGVSETLGSDADADPFAANPPDTDEPQPFEESVAVAPRARRGGTGRVVAVAVVAGLLAGMVGGVGAYVVAEKRSSLTSPGTVLPQSDADLSARPNGSIAAVAAAVLPTVVQIEERNGTDGGTGSGFVLRSDGYILTNNHVVADAAKGGTLTVTFQDGTTKDAKIVGRDSSYDLAVLKVDATGLTASTLGNSDGVVVGDTAVAIGSPLGLGGTVTSGIISSLNRPVTAGGSGESSYINAIQTDAAINPGNSGGPLVDAKGQVIGVNSAIASLGQTTTGQQAGSIGLGFAIPINQAKRVAEEIISTGKSSHPIIGVSVDLTYGGPGALVKKVNPGGPSDKAEINDGDIIVKVDGRTVADSTEMVVAIRSRAPGDTITITVKDDSGTRDVQVTLAADSGTG